MDILTFGFMQKALIAGLFLSLLSGFISFFVVSKDLAFIGTGIAHITFGGLALGVFLQISPALTGALFALFSGLVIALFSFERKVSVNLSVGVFLSFSMAVGILLIKASPNPNTDVFSYLFGSILSIGTNDLIFLGIVCICCMVIFGVFFKKFLILIFDPAYGKAIKIPVKLFHIVLIVFLSASILSMIKVAGTILVEGLLIIPALSGYLIARNYKDQLIYSFIFSFLSIFGGIFLSAFVRFLPSGPAIILTGCLILALCFIFRKRR